MDCFEEEESIKEKRVRIAIRLSANKGTGLILKHKENDKDSSLRGAKSY